MLIQIEQLKSALNSELADAILQKQDMASKLEVRCMSTFGCDCGAMRRRFDVCCASCGPSREGL